MNNANKINSLPSIALLLDSARGVYIPNNFATSFDLSRWDGIKQDDIETLQSGPDHEWYWESWQTVLDNATFSENGYTWHLMQDGDLWAYCPELMTAEEKENFGMNDD